MMKKSRIIYIDYLKTFGLLLVILAHVNCPPWLMQLRNFDVPMLVFISGYLANKSYRIGSYKEYYKKRFLRLVIPTWIFLIFFYIIQALTYNIPAWNDILRGFLFQKDANMVGMVWVIWVYLVCSFLIPIYKKIGYDKRHILIWIIFLVINEFICKYTNISENKYMYMSFMTIIPWGGITYLGFYYDKIDIKTKKSILFCSGITFVLYGLFLYLENNFFVNTNLFKYPARIYYLSYSIFCLIIIWKLIKKINIKECKIIEFISKSTLWIYLWHILLLYIVKKIITNDNLWVIQYILIIILSVAITYIQNIIINKLIDKYEYRWLKIFLG